MFNWITYNSNTLKVKIKTYSSKKQLTGLNFVEFSEVKVSTMKPGFLTSTAGNKKFLYTPAVIPSLSSCTRRFVIKYATCWSTTQHNTAKTIITIRKKNIVLPLFGAAAWSCWNPHFSNPNAIRYKFSVLQNVIYHWV